METMFDRFTDRARKAMGHAREEAVRLESGYIGPEHMMLGLLKEGSGLGHATLAGLVGDLAGLAVEVERLSAPAVRPKGARSRKPDAAPPFTSDARHVLELALEEAAGLKHGYVGTEHLLLGLLRDPEGVAARAIKNKGLSLEQVRREVIHRLPPPPEKD